MYPLDLSEAINILRRICSDLRCLNPADFSSNLNLIAI
ncbi:hypothetical protein BDCR2A_01584 [Borrelia duttonii CR2A]|uniref:Uncharacterized protein n=1 Tax=Borrelia duttonii CR2A TaxID=1432657 RepID=W6TGD8_9SPIR|nr:hypothetical protein BDCR2A_01584 [Borrelia duttonii CR2A]